MDWTTYSKALVALTLWREARGEGEAGMQAVGCVIRNRAAQHGGDYSAVVSAKWQFSSLTAPGDPMLIQWPGKDDVQFQTALRLADGLLDGSLPDITDGATHYFATSIPAPAWAAKMTFIKQLGHHRFYKD